MRRARARPSSPWLPALDDGAEALSSQRNVVVRGQQHATTDEIRDLTARVDWAQPDDARHARDRAQGARASLGGGVREVRIDRRLPSSILVTLGERTAGGLALLDVVWVLDDRGLPIDRFGPLYRPGLPAGEGLGALRASGDRERLTARWRPACRCRAGWPRGRPISGRRSRRSMSPGSTKSRCASRAGSRCDPLLRGSPAQPGQLPGAARPDRPVARTPSTMWISAGETASR